MSKVKELQINEIDDDVWLYDALSDLTDVPNRMELNSDGITYYAAMCEKADTSNFSEILTNYVFESGGVSYYILKRGKIVEEYYSIYKQEGSEEIAVNIQLPTGAEFISGYYELVGGGASGYSGGGSGGGGVAGDFGLDGGGGGGSAGAGGGKSSSKKTGNFGTPGGYKYFKLTAGSGGAAIVGGTAGIASTTSSQAISNEDPDESINGGNGGTGRARNNSGRLSKIEASVDGISYSIIGQASGSAQRLGLYTSGGSGNVTSGTAGDGGNGGGAYYDGTYTTGAGSSGATATTYAGASGGAGGSGQPGFSIKISPSSTDIAGAGGDGGSGSTGGAGGQTANQLGTPGTKGGDSFPGQNGAVYFEYRYWI